MYLVAFLVNDVVSAHSSFNSHGAQNHDSELQRGDHAPS